MGTQARSDGSRFCAGCGKPLPGVGGFCPSCGQPIQPLTANVRAAQPAFSGSASPPPPAFAAGQAPQASMPGLVCPRCGSNRVQAGKRGWKWTTGFIGSGSTVFRCQQCGKTFK